MAFVIQYLDVGDYFRGMEWVADTLDEAIELFDHQHLAEYTTLDNSLRMQLCDKLRLAEKRDVISIPQLPLGNKMWWHERHYNYGMGIHGCMYQYSGSADTVDGAIDAILDNLNDGLLWEDIEKDERVFGTVTSSSKRWYGRDKTYRRELEQSWYVELHPLDGNQYAEISECDCDDPDSHNED